MLSGLSPLRREQLSAALGGLRPQHSHWALVVDGDRTLAQPDTGRLVGDTFDLNERIRSVFEAMGYTADAFASVSKIWGEVPLPAYVDRVAAVGRILPLASAWLEVFAGLDRRQPIIVVTSGIPQIWRTVLDRHGYAEIPVFGGCHPDIDDYLVDGEAKRQLVELLQANGWRVAAAGDSVNDAAMLRQADLRVVVPDHRGSTALRDALTDLSDVWLFDANGWRAAETIDAATLSRLLAS